MIKAYLAWPIKLNTASEPIFKTIDVHLTLKYIGALDVTAEVLADNVADCIAGIETPLDLDECVVKYGTYRINPQTLALLLRTMPVEAAALRSAVDHLASDDYPFWQPHITLPSELGATNAKRLSFASNLGEIISDIGPLTLYVDKKPYRTY